MAKIISGEVEPTEEEMKDYQKSEEIKPLEESEFNKGIPIFWLMVLKNSVIFDALNGNEQDQKILFNLKNITVDYFPAEDCKLSKSEEDSLKFTYKVNFYFDQNEYMNNDVITLKVEYKTGGEDEECVEPSIVTETPINWKEGKDPRYKIVKRRGGRRGGKQRPTAIKQKVESFFDLFYTPVLPPDFDIESVEEIPDDIVTIHSNFKILLELITSTIPSALGYFDESMIDDDDDDEDDMFGDIDGEDDDDDEEEDDDDEEDDEDDGKKKKDKTKNEKESLNAPPVPQECPQQ